MPKEIDGENTVPHCLGPVVMSLTSQVEGSSLVAHLAWPETGPLLSIQVSMANVIRAPC